MTTLSPNVDIVVRDLAVLVTVAPGGGASREFAIFTSSGGVVLECTIAGPSQTCDSGAATGVIEAGSEFQIRARTNPATPAAADALIGWRATTP